jgi:hypothetical protein
MVINFSNMSEKNKNKSLDKKIQLHMALEIHIMDWDR